MNRLNRSILVAALMALSLTANAGNDNANPCGNNGNNCQPAAPTYNQPEANAGALALAGAAAGAIATGGDANAVANGGNAAAFGGAGGQGGAGGNVGDIRNTANGGNASLIGSGNSTALGGAGGQGGVGLAAQQQGQGQKQGQDQDQKQQQSNVGINGQTLDNRNDIDTRTSTSTSTSTQQAQTTDASSKNDNKSTASGNATSVSYSNSSTYVQRRNAVSSAYAPAVYPTASCQKTVSFGITNLVASLAGGASITDKDCRIVVLGQNLASIGDRRAACETFKATGAYTDAIAANPELAKVLDCALLDEASQAELAPQSESSNSAVSTPIQADASKYKYHTVIEGGAKQ